VIVLEDTSSVEKWIRPRSEYQLTLSLARLYGANYDPINIEVVCSESLNSKVSEISINRRTLDLLTPRTWKVAPGNYLVF